MTLYKRAPKIYPIESPNFITITTYDRIHCIVRVRVINPITKRTTSSQAFGPGNPSRLPTTR